MKSLRFVAVAALLAIPATAPANAVTLGGTIAPICNVVESSPGINLNDASLQRVVTLDVRCNKVSAALTITAANGVFAHNSGNPAYDIDYQFNFDLSGNSNTFQSGLLDPNAGQSYALGLVAGAELSSGVPGIVNVDLDNAAVFAGTYTETLTITVG